jgi:hypothetical protein
LPTTLIAREHQLSSPLLRACVIVMHHQVLLRAIERWTVHYDGPQAAVMIETQQVGVSLQGVARCDMHS